MILTSFGRSLWISTIRNQPWSASSWSGSQASCGVSAGCPSLRRRSWTPQRASVSSLDAFTGVIALSGDDRRFAEAGRLARLYPRLKILLSTHTDVAGALTKLGGGIDPSRVILETKSTNTYENAAFGAALIKPQPQDRWLLVTGALHMSRALASFRVAGFNVAPWPIYDDALPETVKLSQAVHEWLGLLLYRALGRTDCLLPNSGRGRREPQIPVG